MKFILLYLNLLLTLHTEAIGQQKNTSQFSETNDVIEAKIDSLFLLKIKSGYDSVLLIYSYDIHASVFMISKRGCISEVLFITYNSIRDSLSFFKINNRVLANVGIKTLNDILLTESTDKSSTLSYIGDDYHLNLKFYSSKAISSFKIWYYSLLKILPAEFDDFLGQMVLESNIRG